jgi:hypothetical protein
MSKKIIITLKEPIYNFLKVASIHHKNDYIEVDKVIHDKNMLGDVILCLIGCSEIYMPISNILGMSITENTFLSIEKTVINE